MGICFSACAVRDQTISDMRADPPLVWRLVSPDDDSPYLNEIGFGRRASLLDRVLGRKKESPVMRTLSFTEPELEMLDPGSVGVESRAARESCCVQIKAGRRRLTGRQARRPNAGLGATGLAPIGFARCTPRTVLRSSPRRPVSTSSRALPVACALQTRPAIQCQQTLNKSWDGLNACLSDRAPDAPQFFEGSGRIGKIEVGYGPALFHMSDTMRTIADAYLSVSEDDLLGAFNRIDMGKRYLGDFWARRDEDAKSCLLENFAALRAFLRHVVDHGLGVVIQYT